MDEELKKILNGQPMFTLLERYDADATIYDAVTSAIKHKETDIIEIKPKDLKDLIETTLNIKEGERAFTPSDIIFADTLPLRDFTVTQKTDYHDSYQSVTYTFNVFNEYPVYHIDFKENPNPNGPEDVIFANVFPDKLAAYYELREKSFDFMMTHFAAMTITIECRDGWTTKFILPMICNHERIIHPTMLYRFEAGGKNILPHFVDEHHRVKLPEDMEAELINRSSLGLTIFYVITIALLNPTIKEVFEKNSGPMPVETGKSTGKNKRAKIRYIRRHMIQMVDVNDALAKRGFVRKAMIWYVTGHWREYQDGKRIFIQGYWKGALRNMKDTAFQNLEPREREITKPDVEGSDDHADDE